MPPRTWPIAAIAQRDGVHRARARSITEVKSYASHCVDAKIGGREIGPDRRHELRAIIP